MSHNLSLSPKVPTKIPIMSNQPQPTTNVMHKVGEEGRNGSQSGWGRWWKGEGRWGKWFCAKTKCVHRLGEGEGSGGGGGRGCGVPGRHGGGKKVWQWGGKKGEGGIGR